MLRTHPTAPTAYHRAPLPGAPPTAVHTMPAPAALLLLALAALVLYAGLCAVSPSARCRRCRGFGHATRTDRVGRPLRGRTCRRCHGTGTRTRIGRRLLDTPH
jgi:hypothetical protein